MKPLRYLGGHELNQGIFFWSQATQTSKSFYIFILGLLFIPNTQLSLFNIRESNRSSDTPNRARRQPNIPSLVSKKQYDHQRACCLRSPYTARRQALPCRSASRGESAHHLSPPTTYIVINSRHVEPKHNAEFRR